MKRFLLIAALLTVSCRGEREIPDAQLARIFRDAFLVNAYSSRQQLRLDSLELYQPIFERYGYTADNVRYTIENFSRRKSAKLADVLAEANRLLVEDGAPYRRQVAALDTIDNVARRRYVQVLREDSLLKVQRLSDTVKLRLRIPVRHEGDYTLSYTYYIDTLDQNPVALRARYWMADADGKSRPGADFEQIMRRFSREKITRTLRADTAARTLRLDLYYTQGRRLESVDMTVTNLRVTLAPDTAPAVDSLFRDQMRLRVFAEKFYAPDSLALPAR